MGGQSLPGRPAPPCRQHVPGLAAARLRSGPCIEASQRVSLQLSMQLRTDKPPHCWRVVRTRVVDAMVGRTRPLPWARRPEAWKVHAAARRAERHEQLPKATGRKPADGRCSGLGDLAGARHTGTDGFRHHAGVREAQRHRRSAGSSPRSGTNDLRQRWCQRRRPAHPASAPHRLHRTAGRALTDCRASPRAVPGPSAATGPAVVAVAGGRCVPR